MAVSSRGSRPSDEGGGVGGGHPDPEIAGGGGLQKQFFRPLGPYFGREMRDEGGGQPPWAPPLVSIIRIFIRAIL